MNFKLKALVGAMGVALASGHASASLIGSSSGNGELFAVVFDTVSRTSFTRDLGISLDTFLASGNNPGFSLSYDLNADSNWANFLSSSAPAPSLRYLVAAGDSTGGTAANGVRYLMTSQARPAITGNNNLGVSNFNPTIDTWYSDTNTQGTHASVADGSNVTLNDNPKNFGKPNELSDNWNSKLTSTMSSAIGTSTPFWYVARSSSSAGGVPTETQFAARTAEFQTAIAAAEDDASAKRVLRHYKNDIALLTALADLGGVWPVMTVTRVLSDAADAAVSAAVRYLFRMASNTKPVVAAAVLLLAEEGKLALSDPAAKYLKSFDNDKSRRITIEQLLTHSSGLRIGPILLPFAEGEAQTLQNAVAKFGATGPGSAS